MKKLMTSAIILLPLLILAIMLVSGAIMSLVTHIFVESVEFVENSALVLEMDDETAPPSGQLFVNILPLKAENRGVSFAVEDGNIVSVDENGKVTAKDFGETYVTVTSLENSAASAKRKVIVTDDDVHSIVIGEHDRELYRGDEPFHLTAGVLPEGATDKRVTWTSSAPDILSVTQNGEVTCLGKGTAVVTVTSVASPEISATMEFHCHLPLQSISADTTPVETAKESAQFPAIFSLPEEATYTLSYTSSDQSIATVDETGAITFRKAGPVTITATAEDGRGNTDSVSVKYDCTLGYYLGRLFGQGEYTFDYDEFAGEELSALAFRSDLDDCTREIESVEFKGPDLLEYHEDTKKFTLKKVGDSVPLGKVEITVNAIKYDKASGSVKSFNIDVCTVTVTRKTARLAFIWKEQEILSRSITSKTLSLFEVKEAFAEGGVGVLPFPANHTDGLAFSMQSDCADLVGNVVNFREEGTATVTVTAGSGASAQLEVEYTALKPTDKNVELGKESEMNITLAFAKKDVYESGVLDFSVPEGYTAFIRSSAEDVVSVEGNKLVPKKGGFADITVSFLPAVQSMSLSGISGESSYIVHVYVDKAVEATDLAFFVGEAEIGSGETFVTSKGSVRLTLRITAKDGALAGKEVRLGDLSLDGDGAVPQEGDVYVLEKEISFDGAQTLSADATVSYNARASECTDEKTGICLTARRSLRSTDGKIESGLALLLGGQPIAGDGSDTLSFGNIGETVELTVDASAVRPADYELKAGDISFYQNDFFSANVSVDGKIATVTLTSGNGTYKAETATLTVAGKTFTFGVRSEVLADTLKVEFGGSALTHERAYLTFLPDLEFIVTPSRTADQKELTAAGKTVKYTFGAQHGSAAAADGNSKTFKVHAAPTAEATDLTIESGTARFVLTLQKKELSGFTFEVTLSYSDNTGPVPLGPFSFDEGRVDTIFPKDMHGSFDLAVTMKEESSAFLGGFHEEDAKAYFALPLEEKPQWSATFAVNGMTAKYTVTPPPENFSFAGESLTLKCGKTELKFMFSKVDLQSVEFPGFDSADDMNGGDVYKGYQQVRVFAKHSDYAAGGANKTVDYFRLPVKALSNLVRETPAEPDSVAWTLTRVTDKDTSSSEILVKQIGKTITYLPDGTKEEYTIEFNAAGQGKGSSTLKRGGQVIAKDGVYESGLEEKDRIPWIDMFAEEGYAHIYFGNFVGLSEVDVQNDYFGNFGERSTEGADAWKPVATHADKYDKSERLFAPSAGAFSYLRVTADDGTEQSKARAHYNFNVLQDDTLVNVFNAKGYYAHNSLVLHENLYGEGELGANGDKFTEATEKGLFLNNKDGLGKTLIYGNGYQVNCQALNASIAADLKSNPENYTNGYNESMGVTFTKAYNATIKCANPSETLNGKTQTIVLKMNYAYYCDLLYYYKFNPSGGAFYTKNTMFSYIPKTAVQLYANENMYAENIVFTECGTAIMVDNKDALAPHIYFKGSLDVLNYYNKQGLEGFNPLLGAYYAEVVPNVQKYVDWHGRDLFVRANSSAADANTDKVYVNIALYGLAPLTENVFVWNGNEYKKAVETPLENGAKLVSQKLNSYRTIVGDLYAWTYDTLDENGNRLDNASIEVDMYVNATLKADLSQLFTEKRYIRLQCEYKAPGEKNYDHILWHMQEVYRDKTLLKGRKSHIEDLKDSLKDTKWADGSGVNGEGEPYDPPAAAALSAMISETVLPSKREFC